MNRREFIKSTAIFGTSVGVTSHIPFFHDARATMKQPEDFSSEIVEGVHRFLDSKTQSIKEARPELWDFDFSSANAFRKSITSQREMLARRLGVVDDRVADPTMEILTGSHLQPLKVSADDCTIHAVRWQVLDGRFDYLWAEGIHVEPHGKVLGRAVILPDADMLPEVLAGIEGSKEPGFGTARQLAEHGIEVLIPVLVSRDAACSGSDVVGRYTNQPHREWIYRQAFLLGRHVIGYELQKIFSAIDWFQSRSESDGNRIPVGVAGYGEGGMLALQAAALDPRISSTLVSGYFDAREEVWQEPIYRNVFGLITYFGDAELAAMTWPRALSVEHAEFPEVEGPPEPSEGRSGAAPGFISTPDFSRAKEEWDRARNLLPETSNHLRWIDNGGAALNEPFSSGALRSFSSGLHVEFPESVSLTKPEFEITDWVDTKSRQKRTVRDMERHIQRLLALCEKTRDREFWNTLQVEQTPEGRKGDIIVQKPVKDDHRKHFREVVGCLQPPSIPSNPRVTLLEEADHWTSYEVRLDVWEGIVAGGILLVPADLKDGEQRAAVVCQHGLEGVPMDLITTDPGTRSFEVYRGFASKLAERGYVTFAPQDLYRGGDNFRQLQRKANPLGLTLYSFIAGQHQRIVEWLGSLEYIDASRIGLYGLSYGGKTAMRVGALIEDYALAICSGDFNEWVRKNASTDFDAFNSYMFTGEYEIFEWDLGHTFNYAEMAALIAPRPFMVERGHFDGVGTDEWVNYEFAKVRRHYEYLNLGESVHIAHFNGGHRIDGTETFNFLDQHLGPSDI